jgi:hypothetical protein
MLFLVILHYKMLGRPSPEPGPKNKARHVPWDGRGLDFLSPKNPGFFQPRLTRGMLKSSTTSVVPVSPQPRFNSSPSAHNCKAEWHRYKNQIPNPRCFIVSSLIHSSPPLPPHLQLCFKKSSHPPAARESSPPHHAPRRSPAGREPLPFLCCTVADQWCDPSPPCAAQLCRRQLWNSSFPFLVLHHCLTFLALRRRVPPSCSCSTSLPTAGRPDEHLSSLCCAGS